MWLETCVETIEKLLLVVKTMHIHSSGTNVSCSVSYKDLCLNETCIQRPLLPLFLFDFDGLCIYLSECFGHLSFG